MPKNVELVPQDFVSQCRGLSQAQRFRAAGADPGFWSGGQRSLDPRGALSPKFAQKCLKTARL